MQCAGGLWDAVLRPLWDVGWRPLWDAGGRPLWDAGRRPLWDAGWCSCTIERCYILFLTYGALTTGNSKGGENTAALDHRVSN
ncbi:hypothetical protein FKM82_011298 [Ascaphus truei]